MDKRKNYSIADKVNMVKEILEIAEKKGINTEIEINLYSYNVGNKDYKEITKNNQKYKLHERHLESKETRWIAYHNGFDKDGSISANIVINTFKPGGGKQ